MAISTQQSPPETPANTSERRTTVLLLLLLLHVVSGLTFLWGRASGNPTPPPTATEKHTTIPNENKVESGLIALTPEAKETAGIRTVVARSRSLPLTLSVPGTIEVSPNQEATITPPVAGKVMNLLVQPGDRVTKGQLLARLDSPEVSEAHAAVGEAEARVARARADVQAAEAIVEQAQSKVTTEQIALARQQELVASGQVSQPSLVTAQNALAEAEASSKAALATLALARSTETRTERLFQAEVAPRSELEQAQTAVRQAEAQSERANTQVTLAKATIEREQRVYRSGVLNRQAIQTAVAALASARGELRQAQKMAEATRTSLTGAVISREAARANLHAIEGNGHAEGASAGIALYAPITGTIIDRHVSIGQAVERATTLFTLRNLSQVIVIAHVPEAEVARIHTGATVSVVVNAYPKSNFTGVVQSIGSSVDAKTRALPVRCLLQNPKGLLKPAMFARVSLTTGSIGRVVAVPDTAIDEDGDRRFVYVATDGGYQKRAVQTGRTSQAFTEITAGLKDGEKVVTDGMFVLKSESKKDELREED